MVVEGDSSIAWAKKSRTLTNKFMDNGTDFAFLKSKIC